MPKTRQIHPTRQSRQTRPPRRTRPLPRKPSGFTLIEIAIALVLILLIFSMVLAAYRATTAAAQRCRQKITLTYQARSLLEKISRQLRTVYMPPVSAAALPSSSTALPATGAALLSAAASESTASPVPFRTGPDADGILLRMITTTGLFHDPLNPDGPFVVAYRFDPARQILYYAQQRYRLDSPDPTDKLNWVPLAEHLERIEITCLKEKQWTSAWNPDTRDNPVPPAVRLDVSFREYENASAQFSTVAYLNAYD